MRRTAWLYWTWPLLACSAQSAERPAVGVAEVAPKPAADAPLEGVPAASAATAPPAPATPFRDCGGAGCRAFATPADAFDFVLAAQPRVLAVGEAHAQSGGSERPSSTRRFMEGFLPRLAPRASDLVIELWVANGSCGKVERQVEEQQKVVTAPQAATNQGEFMELGHRAKALGIMPRALVPSCEQYAKIAGAGAADIEEMLAMLKAVTLRDVTELLTKRGSDRLIVAYGGAMHNDLVPRPGREAFSFGPELARATGERYVELDLIAPEQIKDTETWRAQPWYEPYFAEPRGTETYLFTWAPRAHALIFPTTSAESSP